MCPCNTHMIKMCIRDRFCFESKASGIGLNERHDTIWYRRKFVVPAEMQGKRVWVRFGAVDFECTVYVNGNAVGSHRGGYTPFSVDATPFLQDGENDLCLRVSCLLYTSGAYAGRAGVFGRRGFCISALGGGKRRLRRAAVLCAYAVSAGI